LLSLSKSRTKIAASLNIGRTMLEICPIGAAH
jgi:hypothetical protein